MDDDTTRDIRVGCSACLWVVFTEKANQRKSKKDARAHMSHDGRAKQVIVDIRTQGGVTLGDSLSKRILCTEVG